MLRNEMTWFDVVSLWRLSGGREQRCLCGRESWHHSELATRFGESWQPQPTTGNNGPNPSLLSGGSWQRSHCGELAAEEGGLVTLGNGGGWDEGGRELWRWPAEQASSMVLQESEQFTIMSSTSVWNHDSKRFGMNQN
jgi:hypothetical protein